MAGKPIVFISCGQSTTDEKSLGGDICDLVREIRPEMDPYFAQDQTTVEALSSHMLHSLYRAAGLICIMHERGKVASTHGAETVRGSVWVEQEFAIATFMQHVLCRNIPILFYKSDKITLEGIRSVLLANPTLSFSSNEQVLADLRQRLPKVEFKPFLEYDLSVQYSFCKKNITSARHDYHFFVNVKNTGEVAINDFKLRCFFPRSFVERNTIFACEETPLSTSEHLCFTMSDTNRAPKPLYPADELHNPLTISYYVDDSLYMNPQAMGQSLRLILFSGAMKPKEIFVPISQLHIF